MDCYPIYAHRTICFSPLLHFLTQETPSYFLATISIFFTISIHDFQHAKYLTGSMRICSCQNWTETTFALHTNFLSSVAKSVDMVRFANTRLLMARSKTGKAAERCPSYPSTWTRGCMLTSGAHALCVRLLLNRYDNRRYYKVNLKDLVFSFDSPLCETQRLDNAQLWSFREPTLQSERQNTSSSSSLTCCRMLSLHSKTFSQ